ncbi:hypothetical protein [Natranaerovirga hydrolytica]|nr:hypothetical protein [Natranaerovirga hydrolytica]
MKKKVGGLILVCVAIGMFLMLFIPKGLITILAIVGILYLGFTFLNQ